MIGVLKDQVASEAPRQAEESGAYLSDDVESRLRFRAPTPCRLCRCLVAKVSILTGQPDIRCGRLDAANEVGEVVNNLLFTNARRLGECGEAQLMSELLRA